MSQYAHLSKPDPEYAALLERNPLVELPLPVEAAQQQWQEHGHGPYAASEKARLRPDAKYRVQDYKVPVEGGEITVRAVIPGTDDEGQKYPLLFWTHGGFIFGSLDQDDYFLRNLSTDLQVTTLNVDYRLAPGQLFPTQLNDSFAALKWAVANVDTLSVSLKKGFIIGGCSGGGTLAAGLSIRVRDDPSFSDTPATGIYLPPQYWCTSMRILESIGSPSPTDPEISPVFASSHANLPPTFFQICGNDPLRDEVFLYDRLLREAGCKTFVKVYPGLPHVFHISYPTLKASEQYQSDVRTGLRWLLNGGKESP
ncbi:Alpha/Beta hydrolase protein [Lactarius quietus]|nr:Alpha/Beta hydrolase protein [Lactarius quietus]